MTTKNVEFKITGDIKDLENKLTTLQQKFREMASKTTIGERAAEAYGEGTPMAERAQKMQEQNRKASLEYLQEEHNRKERWIKVYEERVKRLTDEMNRSNKSSEEQNDLIEKKKEAQDNLNRSMEEGIKIAEEYYRQTGTRIGAPVTGAGGGGGLPPTGDRGAGAGAEGGALGAAGTGMLGLGSLMRGAMGAYMKVQIAKQVTQMAGDVVAGFLKHDQEVSKRETRIAQLEYEASGKREELEGDYLRSKFFAPERAAGTEEARTVSSQVGTAISNLDKLLPALIKDIYYGQSVTGAYKDIKEGKTNVQRVFKEAQTESELESIKAKLEKDQELKNAYEYFTAHRGRFLQAQQMSGMGDQELMEFLGRQGGQFTTEQKLNAIQSIYGAGGSTAQGRMAEQALQLQREFGIQSAGQVLGVLSGNIGGGATGAESVTRKILSEAFSVGLDSSKFSRETERFLNITAKFVEESGARTPEAMMRVAESMTPAVMGTSMADVNAAAGAMSNFQSKMGEGAGDYSKALQLSKLRTDPNLGKLSEEDRMMLANLRPEHILAGGEFLERMATRAGFTDYSQFVNAMLGPSGVKSFGATISQESSRKMARIGQINTQAGFNILNKGVYEKQLKDAEPEKQEELKAMREEAMGLSDQLASSMYAQGTIRGKPTDFYTQISPFLGLETEDLLNGRKPEAPSRAMTTFDFADMAAAEGDQQRLENAMKNMDRYSELVENVATETENLAKAIKGAVDKINQILGTPSTMTMPAPVGGGLFWPPSTYGATAAPTQSQNVKPASQQKQP